MLKNAIKKAKGDEEQKIGVSLKMPKSFKEKLQETADNNDVSLNSLIIAMLHTVYEADESNIDKVKELQRLESRYEYLEKVHNNTGDDILETTDGGIYYIKEEMESNKLSQKVIKKELQKASE